jgi:hypothetical protein
VIHARLCGGAGLLTGWMKSLITVSSASSLAVFAGTALVLLMLLLIGRNFAKKPLHRAR